ncbi:MFS general substrate transporter [Calocera viscosa TUFC12733]|uniref:MFS general substrate transporter n=1 Tax=Calocera viscosa (strain TUFC12733) TaxID=1330018 RepID=A0A167QQD4_CALVF|nr:MFS general substrate transporter [Calocera viscosa TUFC12733]
MSLPSASAKSLALLDVENNAVLDDFVQTDTPNTASIEKLEDLSSSPVVPALVSLDIPFESYPEGGRGWWVVVGCAIISAGTPGVTRKADFSLSLSWGVFQTWYKEYLFPDVEDSVLSFLGSLAGMISTPVAFVVGKLADKYGYRPFITAGCACCFVSMLVSAFCTALWQFFLAQGVLAGVGLGLVLPIVMSYPSQWFRRKRGLATGFVIAACSFAGGATTLIAEQLLNKIGLRWTLLSYACLYGLLMVAGLSMLKSRAHPGVAAVNRADRIRWVDRALFADPVFWSLSLAIMLAFRGYLSPYFYIEEYTRSIIPGVSPELVTVPAAVMNFAAALGRTLVGHAADRVGACNAFIIAVGMAGVVQLLIWNFAYNYATVMVASITFGFFGGTFLSLTSVMGASLYGVNNLATLSGILTLFNTPGKSHLSRNPFMCSCNAAGAPIGGAILSAANNNWHALISYSGATQIAGAALLLYARFKREPRLFAVI